MPLTFAHPAAVIPLRRCGLPFTALIVGSIAPDFEYLVHFAPRSEISHTIGGLFIFCIPMGLIALWIFHRVWKQPVLALLAGNHAEAEGYHHNHFPFLPLSRLAILGTAVLVGAMTHLAWDSFTHHGGWMAQQAPFLTTSIFETRWGAVPLFKFLQHGSTILGLAVLASMAVCHKEWMRHVSPVGWERIVLICGTSIAVGVGVSFLETGRLSDMRAVQRFAGISIIMSSVAFIVEVTLLSLIWHARERKSVFFR